MSKKWHKTPHEVNPEWGLNHYDLQTLATYNAERGRGIVHTKEWTLKMEGLQQRFDAAQYDIRRYGRVPPHTGDAPR